MLNCIDVLLNLYSEYCKKLYSIEELIHHYIDDRENYSRFNEIIHNSIISSIYSSWEYFSKELMYYFFEVKKSDILTPDHIKEHFNFGSFPPYVKVDYSYIETTNSFSLNIDKSIINFTNRNIDLQNLNDLFKKVRINNINDLVSNINLNSYIDRHQLEMERDGHSKVERVIKAIVNLRNEISHNGSVVQLLDLNLLKDELLFFVLLSKQLILLALDSSFKNEIQSFRDLSDNYKFYAKHESLAFDLKFQGTINKETKVLVFSDGKLSDIVKINSIKVTNSTGMEDKDEGVFNQKIGLQFIDLMESSFSNDFLKLRLAQNFQYKILA